MIYLGNQVITLNAISKKEPVSVPLGAVKSIKFSIIDNVLNVSWNDPDNVIVDEMVMAEFGATKLMAKLDGYPTSHEDGVQLYSGTIKNAHALVPVTADLEALGLVSEGHTAYFRFFSMAKTTDYWNDSAQLGDANRFTSDSYDWSMIYSALKDFQASRNLSILPNPGDQLFVDYILSDYYLSGTTKVACETRQSVVENADKLSTVSIPFHVLAYNANVPQYIPYKKTDLSTGTTDYVYVQSVDDSISVVNAYDAIGNSIGQLTVDIGSYQFREVTPGNRVYTEDAWNVQTSKKSYTYTGKNVQAVSQSTFPYDNEGTGTQYIYSAPIAISVDGEKYDFCGYTMTLQPVYNLIGVTTAGTNIGIQFDASENSEASPFESFQTMYDPSMKYYTVQNNGLHEIDWSTLVSHNINELDEDVYCIEDNKLVLKTAYYERYHKYSRKTVDGTSYAYQKLIEVFDFTPGETYYPNCEPKNYDASYNLSVYGDIVRYNGTLYICKAQVTVGSTTPDQLTANFRILSSTAELSVQAMYDEGDYFVSGAKIPTSNGDGVVVETCIIYRNSGCNLYEESFYKQYCNNINGSRTSLDQPYKKMNRFDVVSTGNLANSNSLMLKLYKEPALARHICKAANRTVLSLKNYQYRKNWQFVGSGTAYNTGRWETSLDLFWPLSYYEVFGSGADASNRFSIVYPDNNSRIKYNMTTSGGAGAAAYWWLRYPNPGTSNNEYYVYTSGSATITNATNTNGFSPAFIIC